MCGIMGEFSIDGAPIDPAQLKTWRDVLSHRGPDGSGLWISNHRRVGLAHRRLAILDTSEAGLQPMRRSPDGPVIIYNGEIFNYRELRDELEGQGSDFTT